MFDWLAFGWNLAMLVSGSFLGSQTFRGWPLRWTRRNALLHLLLTSCTVWLLRAYPTPLIALTDASWPSSFADLRYVVLVSMLLAYGPLWAGVSGLLMVTPELLGAGLGGHPAAGLPPLLAMSGVLVSSLLLRTPFSFVRFDLRQALWRIPLMLAPAGLPFLLRPGGWAGLGDALLFLACNLLGFAAGVAVNRSRFKLLAVSFKLTIQAHTDVLTGLWNRRRFEEDLARLPVGSGLLVIDLDHFKTINDRFGHEVGDEYLVGAAAALLRSMIRPEQAYRLGGEEFAVLLPSSAPGELLGRDSAAGAWAAAQEVLAHIREVSHHGHPGDFLTCSVGLAILGSDETPHMALRRADLALFRAKATGRDRAERADEHSAAAETETDKDIRPLEPLFWEALYSSIRLAAIDRDLTGQEWTRLLQIAILSVPNAELGTINVREGEVFVQCAQVGFNDNLIGLSFSKAEQLSWYGLGEAAWLRGQPRVLYGQEIAARSGLPFPENQHIAKFEQDGRIHEIQVTLCMPLLMDGEVVAHLNLDRVGDTHPFDDEDLRIARAFADQITVLTVAARRRKALTLVPSGRSLAHLD
ncbi:diguanylate cyclase domain-containing protein [Deinococcus sp.]|uniref:diguanylate cyclase domain-containing protein n=1 Tax=Deinococcus sp. TaxID=47478 RepID=UPI003CC6D928